MNIIITGRHLELTSNLKKYAEGKLKKFNKYLNNVAEATVTLSVEKYRHRAEVLLKANGLIIQAESVTGEMYSSIDDVTEKLERQLKKYKDKWISYRKGEEKEVVKELETRGIGRPSTYKSIISTLLDRLYIEKQKKTIHVTEMGIKVSDFLIESNFCFIDLGFTAELEETLDRIAHQDADKLCTLRNFWEKAKLL